MSSPRQVSAADALHPIATEAARRASDALLSLQNSQGYWWADLTADTTLEADFILLQLWLHPPVDGVWNPPTQHLVEKAVTSIFRRQLPNGGFYVYPEGPPDVSATVKAYFALKLAGIPVTDSRMVRAKNTILELGGIQAANSYVKLNLSFFGLFPREFCPSVPPEMMLLPGNFIYQMSSWTRAIVIPLSIIHAMDPKRPVPSGFDLKELFAPGGTRWSWLKDREFLTWRNVFLSLDQMAKFWENFGSRGLRRRAILRAEQWMLERTKYSDGLGAIYPSMMYIIMALDLLGYSPEHPDRAEAQKQFENLMIEREDEIIFQPCFSPVWDTAIAAFAVGEAGFAPPGSLRRTGDWLLSKEVRRKGDWSVKRPNTEPSGWYFEFANEFYPDIDDTAMVLLGLDHTRATSDQAWNATVRRAVRWLLDMQGKDGGWAAFDVDNNWTPLSFVPFADHNAMLDPSCPDITGRVVEALCRFGVSPEDPAIRRAVDYLLATQEQDGSWFGRWGVNYVYGTFLALRGLKAAGVSDREAAVLRAGEWIRSIQNADGGWGESCESYSTHCFAPGPSTASQTGWAVLGLIAGGDSG
ncbi:MAG: squalene--hopene cyclase, partial [Bryobacteraceae bacterium]|nr:squalene--hopene cyclase [Bryobacteraceae bacterium]